MFRPRRATLVQQLWRRRCVTPGPEDGHALLKPAAHAFFKKLRDPELEALLQAVEGKGAGESACVWVEARGFKPGLPPVLLLCRLYRWPDLGHPHELKRLSFCSSAGGEASTHCCNPHHLSRLAVPETPPPAYGKTSPFALPLKSPTTTFGRNRNAWQDTTLSRHSLKDGYWCKLAYWEYRLRVGRLYPVHDDSVRVFGDASVGRGFCLAQLGPRSRSPAVGRARAKIGRGLLISREGPGVWVYNRGDHPCFVSSPALGPSVHKVPPGYAVKVYDEQRAGDPAAAGWPCQNEGPYDAHAVRVSFGKGWGPCYSRRYITSCPCWMEILLNITR